LPLSGHVRATPEQKPIDLQPDDPADRDAHRKPRDAEQPPRRRVMWFFSATAWGVWITLQKAATLFGL